MKKTAGKTKYILAALMLAGSFYLLTGSDFSDSLSGIRQIGVINLLILMGLQGISMLLVSMQWKQIASDMSEDISFGKILVMNLTGTFLESVTPSAKAGGEAAKIWYLKRNTGIDSFKAARLVIIQKLVSFISFGFLFSVFVFLFATVRSNGSGIHFLLYALIPAAAFAMVFLLIKGPLTKKGKKSRIKKISSFFIKAEIFLKNLSADFTSLHRNVKAAARYYIYGIVIWLLFAFKAFLVINYINGTGDFILAGVLAFVPYMAGMLPVLPGGLLLYEGSFTSIAVLSGISSGNAVAAGIVLRFVTFWVPFIVSGTYVFIKNISGKITVSQKA